MKRLLYICIGITVLLFASCMRDETERYNTTNKFDLSVGIAPLEGEAITRATVESKNGENKVSTLYLLFFEPDANRGGKFVDYIAMKLPDEGVGMNISSVIDFNGTALHADNSYQVLVIANIGDNQYITGSVDDWMQQWEQKTEMEVMSTALGSVKTNVVVKSDALLMTGRFTKDANQSNANVMLTRNLVRFDVYNETTDYDIVSASVWNAYPNSSLWNDAMVDYSDAATRIHRHYGVDNSGNEIEGGNGKLGNIIGGLYAFENRVASVKQNDALTTCLIVGLRKVGETKHRYFRANMSKSAAQQLIRNTSYSLSIKGVNAEGEETEELAYLGVKNQLDYSVDLWNLDDNGLIIQDEHSVLSIPSKTINIGRDGGVGVAELSIITSSDLPNPAPLTIRSQTYSPMGTEDNRINARLNGNTLVIDAGQLELNMTERNGIVVISYAGLEASISISQSGVHDDYLKVTLPDGGIPRFLAYAGIPSGLINVRASGPWTAKVYETGFSFNPSTALAPVITLTSTDPLIVDDSQDQTIKKFRVYTHSFNTGDAPRSSFIMITLDKNPKAYSAIVSLSQDFVKKLHIRLPGDPEDERRETASVIFNGAGGLVTSIADNSDKFFVISGKNANQEILPWNAVLTMNGLTDDSGYFEIVESGTKTHISDLNQNYVTVKAKGINTTGRELKATLRVQTDPGTFADITVVQQPANWKVPQVLEAVPAVGGETAKLKLDAYSGMNYTVEIESVSGINHFAYVAEVPGGAYYSKLKPRDTAEPFVVGFPKLLYPNLLSPVSATVKVTIVESGESKTFTVLQTTPVQKTVNIFNVGLDWGGISDNGNKPNFTYTVTSAAGVEGDDDTSDWYGYYCGAWARAFHTTSYFGNSGAATVKINTIAPGLASAENGNFVNVNSQVIDATTFIHFTRPAEYTSTDWGAANTTIWDWITDPANDGVLLVNAEAGDSESIGQFDSNHVPGKMGLTGGSANDTYNVAQGTSKVMDYLTTSGPFGVNSRTSWTTEGVTSYLYTSSVESIDQAVPVLVNSDGRCAIMVDPKRRIVVKTDSEMVRNNVEMSPLILNLQAWLVNTAQYGTHFSEYFWDSPRVKMAEPQPQK